MDNGVCYGKKQRQVLANYNMVALTRINKLDFVENNGLQFLIKKRDEEKSEMIHLISISVVDLNSYNKNPSNILKKQTLLQSLLQKFLTKVKG